MRHARWFAAIALVGAGCLAIDYQEPQDVSVREAHRDRRASFFIERRIESFAREQDRICEELEATEDPATKARNAHILAELWQRGLLENEIKDRLVDNYYRAVLFQFCAYPGFHSVVRSHQTFPFPSVWMKFTPTLRANGRIIWSPATEARREHALSLNNSMITSLSGCNLRRGKIKKGDMLQYTIKMQQEVEKEIVWEKTILTNQIVVQDFEN